MHPGDFTVLGKYPTQKTIKMIGFPADSREGKVAQLTQATEAVALGMRVVQPARRGPHHRFLWAHAWMRPHPKRGQPMANLSSFPGGPKRGLLVTANDFLKVRVLPLIFCVPRKKEQIRRGVVSARLKSSWSTPPTGWLLLGKKLGGVSGVRPEGFESIQQVARFALPLWFQECFFHGLEQTALSQIGFGIPHDSVSFRLP